MTTIPYTLTVYRYGGREKLMQEARCRMCLTPRRRRGVRRLTRHHLVPQRWGGWNRLGFRLRDADANLVPVCEACHRAVESDPMARAMLRKVLGSNEVAFVIAVRGQEWFDSYYPRLGRGASRGAQSPAHRPLRLA